MADKDVSSAIVGSDCDADFHDEFGGQFLIDDFSNSIGSEEGSFTQCGFPRLICWGFRIVMPSQRFKLCSSGGGGYMMVDGWSMLSLTALLWQIFTCLVKVTLSSIMTWSPIIHWSSTLTQRPMMAPSPMMAPVIEV